MSHSAYNKLWADAQAAVTGLLDFDLPPEPPKPEKDRQAAFQTLAVVYCKYIQVFRKLEESYDQIVHPQKRLIIRHILDGVMGRILEIKNNMVNLEFSEYHYFDDTLSDLKLTPEDIEIPIPKYFLLENQVSLTEKKKMMDTLLASSKMERRRGKSTKLEPKMSKEEAVKIIQVHERARQGRLRSKFMKEIRAQEERERSAALKGSPSLDRNQPAIIIQRNWRGYLAKRQTEKQRDEELIFLGMKLPPEAPAEETPMFKAKTVQEMRRQTQQDNEREYRKALISVKDKLRDVDGPEIRETMQDKIRQWFIDSRDATGKFPEYPSEEDGGSALLFKPKDPAEIEAEQKKKEEEEAAKAKGKGKGKDKKGKEKKGKKGGKGKGGKGGGDEEEEVGIVFDPSNFVKTIAEVNTTYNDVWKTRDESSNFDQRHDVELIKEEKRVEVEEEVRQQVDELMRLELKNLKSAVDRDKGKKGKKGKSGKKSGKKKKGKKSGKKSGKKGKKKGKKEKDLTADRTIESLYEELVSEGILIKPSSFQMKDLVGGYSYLSNAKRQSEHGPMPSMSDVRRVVTEFCILPLGSQTVHENAPLIKSTLLAGPPGVGKRLLVNAICNATGANLFDLTASNIVGKYPGKSGLNMMLHMVFKVAKQLPPSVVHVGECHKTFMKKLPKGDKSDAKRLKKDLPKIMKGLKGEDRVLLIGTSEEPFSADVKPFCSLYQKILLIPPPDYGSRVSLWSHLITKHGGIITNSLNISSLAKVTEGYTAGRMETAIQSVLTERRIKQLQKKPLSPQEFIPHLAKFEPVTADEEETIKIWYTKTPLGKKRVKACRGGDDDGGDKGGKKGKKGKKKK